VRRDNPVNQEENMAAEVEKYYAEVVRAMEKLIDAFDQRVEELRKMGRDEDFIKSITQGANAMKDSCGIYLTWTRHYMVKLNESDDLEEDDEPKIVEK
jgi:hypothetical protein